MMLIDIRYGTVREYNRFLDEYPKITPLTGDLKNFQRPWIVDTILKYVSLGGRLLEIGADRCELADFLQKKGYEIWVIDKYDSFGGGTGNYEVIKRKFKKINVLKGLLHEDSSLPPNYFDAVYSCSVIEHIPIMIIPATVRKIYECLRSEGYSIHAIDYTIEGSLLKNQKTIEEFLKEHHISLEFNDFNAKVIGDIDAFYLSPQGHYFWRKYLQKNYDEYPYRKVTSFNIITSK